MMTGLETKGTHKTPNHNSDTNNTAYLLSNGGEEENPWRLSSSNVQYTQDSHNLTAVFLNGPKDRQQSLTMATMAFMHSC